MANTAELNRSLQERIIHPVVASVYDEWKKRDLLEVTNDIVSQLPDRLAEPALYSFSTHVHKEKGLFLDLIGEQVEIPEFPRHALAASSDMLWAISLMVDDIVDRDVTRGNRESSWVKYGKETTMQSAEAALRATFGYLAKATDSRLTAESGLHYVNLGIESLILHKRMSIGTPRGIITRNYEQRCDFHGTYQLLIMSELLLGGKKREQMELAISGLRGINRAGQLINDLKDLIDGDIYKRSFSDIRNGVPTVPLTDLVDMVGSDERKYILQLFGKGELTVEEQFHFAQIVDASGVASKTLLRVADAYSDSIKSLATFLDAEKLSWFEKWIGYKESLFVSSMKGAK